jgi:hypothetical protein
MNLRTTARTLAVAALLAMTVASVSAPQTDARPKRPGDNGVLCAVPGHLVGATEDWVFYLPGQEIEINGKRYECYADGSWGPAIWANTAGGGVYSPTSGGVYAPASGGLSTPKVGGVYAPKAGGVLARP